MSLPTPALTTMLRASSPVGQIVQGQIDPGAQRVTNSARRKSNP
jgi:hypothetical protein